MGRATAIIEGRVGSTPEPKFSKGGTTYTRFGVAVTERVKDGDDWVDGETTWFNVTCFKGLAETVVDTVQKGDLVLASGRIKMEAWTGEDGVERNNLSMVADSLGVMRKNQRAEAPF